MKTSIMATGLTLSMLAGSVLAGSVSTEDMTTFTTGTAISASEMNTNFNAVTGAVNGNADDIATLNSTISTLQSTITTMENSIAELTSRMDTNDAFITLNEMVGKTYCLISDWSTLTFDTTTNWARVNLGNDSRTLTIDSESQATLSSGTSQEGEMGLGVNFDGDYYVLNGEVATQGDTEASQVIGISGLSNGVLTLNPGDSTLEFFVSKRGDMLIGREFIEGYDNDDDAVPQREVSSISMVECR